MFSPETNGYMFQWCRNSQPNPCLGVIVQQLELTSSALTLTELIASTETQRPVNRSRPVKYMTSQPMANTAMQPCVAFPARG